MKVIDFLIGIAMWVAALLLFPLMCQSFDRMPDTWPDYHLYWPFVHWLFWWAANLLWLSVELALVFFGFCVLAASAEPDNRYR